MKFAKELEHDLVPEWRAKYFDYKTGKKKVKAVARALRSVNATPRTPGRQIPSNLLNSSFRSPTRNPDISNEVGQVPTDQLSPLTEPAEHFPSIDNAVHSSDETKSSNSSKNKPQATATVTAGRGKDSEEEESSESPTSPTAIPTRPSRPFSSQTLETGSSTQYDSGDVMNYGSFVPSPPTRNPVLGPPALELPDPALPPDNADSYARHNRAWRRTHHAPTTSTTPIVPQHEGRPGDAYRVGPAHASGRLDTSHLLPKHKRFLRPRRHSTTSPYRTGSGRPRFFDRVFSPSRVETGSGDVPLEAYKVFEDRQDEFFKFLDSELSKIEGFYKQKEAQANKRLQILRDQLHKMRNQRIDEIKLEQEAKRKAREQQEQLAANHSQGILHQRHPSQVAIPKVLKWLRPIESAMGIGPPKIGKTSKALQKLGSPSGPHPTEHDSSDRPESWRDFTRRPQQPDIPFRAAKRKLKLALQEFYRGLELLKSYALLNRTAFRKINKKYDKALKARPTQRYMTEKVNKAWFVQSEVLDHQIVAVEDLYARYFERGNHKIAVGKLRSKASKSRDHSASLFRSGLLLAGGAIFGLQGIVYGAQYLNHPDAKIHVDTSYLLQIYGGYFLMLLLFLLFCLNCKVWTRAKINYPFIFEFDPRNDLNWEELCELPSLLLFILGLIVWLNFQQSHVNSMFLYWPVLLIGLSAVILFFPGPLLYHRSREWWAYSNFRLLFAGFYPVEFRDFFLGDMYCSQTYAMGNISLFFCLYAHGWNNPPQCNSNHSRLLGFFSTLPGIWRALQCIRRYYDTRNAFPHLVNCGKYTFTILSYMTLSIYRINTTAQTKAIFITASTVNSVYTSIWDLAMDWSLGNPYAEHPFLRDVLGYKRPQAYYIAMILDPILRFNWIFYAIYSHDIQHSGLLSFFVAFSEVCRRAMWTLFRVENEHSTNVGRFRASRDVPLPYDLPSTLQDEIAIAEAEEGNDRPTMVPSRRATYADPLSTSIEAQQPSPFSSMRRRATLTESDTPILRGMGRVGAAINQAHAQDFERKRKPIEGTPGVEGLIRSPHHEGKSVGYGESSEEEDEDEEEYDEEAEQEHVEEAQVTLEDAELAEHSSRHGLGHGHGGPSDAGHHHHHHHRVSRHDPPAIGGGSQGSAESTHH